MKLKKAVSLALFLVMAISILATPAQAVQLEGAELSGVEAIITPFWVDTAVAKAALSVSNRVLKPSVYVKAKSTSTEITGTLYLEKKSGSSWKEVKSWDISGTGTLTVSKSYTGTVYRSRVVVSVGGETVKCTSSEVEA